ncbi:MAG TPA: hypothetical protein VLA71_05125 [Algoriphagus sp.]|nr:hypothetical protein [Algoriphagus sp.]
MEQSEFNAQLSLEETSRSEILWFPFRDKEVTQTKLDRLKQDEVNFVRLGIDCTEFNSEKGVKWFDWLLPTLGESFELELCFDNFSKNSGEPIFRKHSLFEIVEHFIFKHGEYFTTLELWKNPSTNSNLGASENIFADDVVFAATWARHWGKNVVLGGIQSLDFEWFSRLSSSQLLRNAEFVEINREKDQWNIGIRFGGQPSLNNQSPNNRFS